jgi:hypothetical protein
MRWIQDTEEGRPAMELHHDEFPRAAGEGRVSRRVPVLGRDEHVKA